MRTMGRTIGPTVLGLCALMLGTGLASAADKPEWAFPTTEKVQPPSKDDPNRLRTAAGSTLAITRAQVDDMFNVPNWFPDMYPAMPKIN